MRYAVAAFLVWVIVASAPAQAQPVADVATVARASLGMAGGGETRALVVMQQGQPTFEHYGPGFSATNRFVSWSMAKTVTAFALGLLVDAGKLNLDAPAPVAAWQNDARGKITLRHLLTMTSGLAHQEGGEGGKPIQNADTVRMLFSDGAHDAAAYAVARPLAYPPGTHWQYSSATTHILAEIVTNAVTTVKGPMDRRRVMAAWFKTQLWDPLGITSAEWDFDQNGLFLGGSMLHMTALDYARLGQFLLDGGKTTAGRALLSDGWMQNLLAKANAANNNHYAGQLWLNTGPAAGQAAVLFHPGGGADTVAMVGHLGQYVVAAPGKRAVVVRLGKSTTTERGAVRKAIGQLIDALPQPR
jgi:CubicO group peptidase (beta-lactamase class C family)